MNHRPASEETTGIRGVMRKHPVITTTIGICSVTGAVAGGLWEFGGFLLWRRIAFGAAAGVGVGFIVTATRMLGAFSADESTSFDD